MPADFLTDEQARRYGSSNGDPTPSPLPRHFYLDASDNTEEFWALASASADERALSYSLERLADT